MLTNNMANPAYTLQEFLSTPSGNAPSFLVTKAGKPITTIYSVGLPWKPDITWDNFEFPTTISPEEVHRTLDDAFSARDYRVNPDYFNPATPLYPHDLAFLVYAHDIESGELAGVSIAVRKKMPELDGIAVLIYDKVAVAKKYQGNGVGHGLVMVSKHIAAGDGEVSLLRTSDPQTSTRLYEPHSDSHEQHGKYVVHGFYLNQQGNELFTGAKDCFHAAAPVVASQVATIIPIHAEIGHGLQKPSYGASNVAY